MLRLFIIFSSCFDKNLLEKWLEINDFGLDIIGRSVTILPPRLNRQKQETKADEKPKLKVAAYCRVSTDSDEQATSYETQIEHYTLFIQNNPEWVLAGIFADE